MGRPTIIKDEDLHFEKLFNQHLIDWPDILILNLYSQVGNEIIPTDKGYELIKYKNLPWDSEKEGYIVENLDTVIKGKEMV